MSRAPTSRISPWQQKFEESRKSIERLHPGHGKELEKPMYVTWGQIPDNEGSWIRTLWAGAGEVASLATADGEATATINPGTRP